MTSSSSTSYPSPPKDVIVKINGQDYFKERTKTSENTSTNNAGRMWKDSTYNFSNDAVMRVAANNKDFYFVTESLLSRIAESLSTNYGQLTPKEVRDYNPRNEQTFHFIPMPMVTREARSSNLKSGPASTTCTQSVIPEVPTDVVNFDDVVDDWNDQEDAEAAYSSASRAGKRQR
ncbi:unnamed protein product [Fraxinus pennsylvanica]|uniref:Uncharacterized protein n=1 Tax=Fraxinus pennsylvanica TaxID=56036 RepID=A0AAD2DUQ3_9LAMI|nr:unnamed protein product [Fraxinus pennsylvanica]